LASEESTWVVNPAQHANWSAELNRCTSPTSATKTPARTGPTP
jgi:hypothetical protein